MIQISPTGETNMKKLAMTLLASAFVMGAASPALANEAQTDADKFITDVSTIPARLIGVTAGIGAGVPLAAAQSTFDKTDSYYKSISNALPDSDSPANKAYSMLLALPTGLASGLINGTYYGVKHGMQGFERPFSAESFSVSFTRNLDEY
jgi:hypothetical protein